uniref:Omega-class glutathione transferase n=1 Tax=Nephromyces sp. MMRI TaxID=2496275 RepID=A0A3Q8UC24_9APIC|nr:omega-class glutathione transferase [Nephromyces sp. MMRI]
MTKAFVRHEPLFRNWVKKLPDSLSAYPAEDKRYHLVVSLACPWAHRCLMTRSLKGLEDCISVSIVHPVFARTKPTSSTDLHAGWQFETPGNPPVANSAGFGSIDCDDVLTGKPDPVISGAIYVRDIYERHMERDDHERFTEEQLATLKYSVPILWCKKTQKIVSNESSEIIRMLNDEFNDFSKCPQVDLFPPHLLNQIESVNSWVFTDINNGVYKCGFGKDQHSYDEAIETLFSSLDRAENILSKSKFLCGDTMTAADIRLFATLIRFDEVYVVYFKTNCKMIRSDYPNLLRFCSDIYHIPEIKKTVNMKHIKQHYYTSHPTLNYYAIIPKGPDFLKTLDEFKANRQSF